MARLLSFKRTRRQGDVDTASGDQPDPALPPPDAAQNAPAPELPPNEVAAGEPASEESASGEAAAEEIPNDEQSAGKKRAGLRKVKGARPPRPPVANLSRVRRERRALMRERERRIRDLGGLMLEMYRRDQFSEDLIVEHCAQAMGVENRIHELESILKRARSGRATPGPQCACGAPLLFGARFCANCGRPTELAAAGEQCARCLQPLAVGASFCANCGAAVGETADSSDQSEQTLEHISTAEPGAADEKVPEGET